MRGHHHAFSAVEVIGKKREGKALTEDEILAFVNGYVAGDIPDYQCAAFLMAVCCKGMTAAETGVLTRAMKDSGTTADLSEIPGPKVDKHSTGGVGDKTSLILAPMVASLGAVVPMMSGRGLDHTGGTLDKLESIPGYRVAMSSGEFKEVLRTVGVAIISTTDDMAPADKKMYALRDVTSTVQSLPLITGSIMCKKLAENPDSLVLDVKTGAGAFMVAESDAIALAKSMIATGEADGKCTTAFVTSMDQPLGRAIGNWLEVAESILTLRGEGPKDLEDLSVSLAAQMLVQAHGSGKGKESRGFHCRVDAEGRVRETMRNGEALAAFRRMCAAQGGDVGVIDSMASSPHGPETQALSSGATLKIYQAHYGAGDAKPCAVADVHNLIHGGPHGCFWGPPCQGLEGCRSLDAYFRRAYGVDSPPDGGATDHPDADSLTAVERSQRAPHGPTLARVASLNALEVGRACVGIGAGRRLQGEALSLGSGLILHKKIGDPLRQVPHRRAHS